MFWRFLFGLGIRLLQRLVKLESARAAAVALGKSKRKAPERVAPGLPTLSLRFLEVLYSAGFGFFEKSDFRLSKSSTLTP
jgi:hypothetical protein